MPSTMRQWTCSRNTTHARLAVNTASRFRSSDATDAGVRVRPTMSSSGPATPPARMAPASHGAAERRLNALPRSPAAEPVGEKPGAGPNVEEPRQQLRRHAAQESLGQRRARAEEERRSQREPHGLRPHPVQCHRASRIEPGLSTGGNLAREWLPGLGGLTVM